MNLSLATLAIIEAAEIEAIFFILSLFFLLDLNQLNEAIFKVIFIGLASLTFQHILLEYLIEKNEK